MVDIELSRRMGGRAAKDVLLGISRGIDDTVRLIETQMRISGSGDRKFLSVIRDHLDYINGDYVRSAMVGGGYPLEPMVSSVPGSLPAIKGRYGEPCVLLLEDGIRTVSFHRGLDDFEYTGYDCTRHPVSVLGVDECGLNEKGTRI